MKGGIKMPCYLVTYIGVRLDLADHAAAQEAVREVANRRGIGIYLDAQGRAQVPEGYNADEIGNEVKRIYAGKKILEAGKKYGWKTNQTKQDHFEFVRR